MTHLMHYIRDFLKGYQACELYKVRSNPQRQRRINLKYTSMSKLSCDIKYTYRASTDHKFILVDTDKIPKYLVTIFWIKKHCIKLETLS